MRNKTPALIQHKKSIIVEKAVMLSKPIQLRLDFDLNATIWIPRSQKNKPMPQINLTLNAGTDGLRIGADTAEEISDALCQMAAFVDQNKEMLNKMAEAERDTWFKLAQTQVLQAKKEIKLTPIKKIV